MTKAQRGYMMVGGTLLPAFLAVGLVSLLSKSPISVKETKYVLAFAAASIIGGFVSAKMLKEN